MDWNTFVSQYRENVFWSVGIAAVAAYFLFGMTVMMHQGNHATTQRVWKKGRYD